MQTQVTASLFPLLTVLVVNLAYLSQLSGSASDFWDARIT